MSRCTCGIVEKSTAKAVHRKRGRDGAFSVTSGTTCRCRNGREGLGPALQASGPEDPWSIAGSIVAVTSLPSAPLVADVGEQPLDPYRRFYPGCISDLEILFLAHGR
jgi:hypothetical protein